MSPILVKPSERISSTVTVFQRRSLWEYVCGKSRKVRQTLTVPGLTRMSTCEIDFGEEIELYKRINALAFGDVTYHGVLPRKWLHGNVYECSIDCFVEAPPHEC